MLAGFNSTTVQLIPSWCFLWFFAAMFQFHNGTINTKLQPNVLTHPTVFQFHNGTINT